MKRNADAPAFFRSFAEPTNTRALSEERRDRGSSFPSLRALDSAKRARLAGVRVRGSSTSASVSASAPAAADNQKLTTPSPTPPSEVAPIHRTGSFQCRLSPSPPTCEGAIAGQPAGGADRVSSCSSSFSSLPLEQQSQSSIASKRVVKDGLTVVRTSDSEEDSVSESSLEDLSTILQKKRRAQDPLRPSGPATKAKEDGSTAARGLRSCSKPVPSKREFQSIVAPRKEYSIKLSDLVAESRKGLDAKARLSEAERKADEATKAEGESKKSNRLTQEGLSMALGDDSGAQKTLDALRRTEALETRQAWQFFAANGHRKPARSFSNFPAHRLSNTGWQARLADSSTRKALFISGVVKSRVYTEPLPDEVILWMLEELCDNRNEDLEVAYLDVLHSSAPQLQRLLDKRTISGLFEQIGARKEAIAIEDRQPAIRPAEVYPNDPKATLTSGTRPLLELLRRAAPDIQDGAVEYVLEVLIRLSFDDSVRQHGFTQTLCQEAIAAMLRTLPGQDEPGSLQRVSQTLFANFKNHGSKDDRLINHVLQAQLVQSLPFGTRREAAFQRRLALAFFLDSPKPLTLSLTASGILPAVLQSLTLNALYRFGRSTDYADVTAAFTLLDIAVDNGFSNRAFAHTLRSIGRRANDAALRQLRDAARAAEDEFNLGIDALTAAIRRIAGQIRGSGTDSVRMSEAKGAMERLVYRLESSVRTREKSGKDIFAGGGAGGATLNGGGGGDARLLEAWVAGARAGGDGGRRADKVDGDASQQE